MFEFCEHDLAGILMNSVSVFTLGEMKMVMKQLLNALYFMQVCKILHRDLKTANILMTTDGILKVADFGLAKPFSDPALKPRQLTNRVVTLWYRAPELLLGEQNYGPSIDIWSVGCIMAELWKRKPLLQGDTEQTQLKLICGLCGSITPDVWPTVTNLKLYRVLELPRHLERRVKTTLRLLVTDEYALDLLDKLLTLDPDQRIDAERALDHDFFWNDQMPADLRPVISRHTTSMFEYTECAKRNPNRTAVQPGQTNSFIQPNRPDTQSAAFAHPKMPVPYARQVESNDYKNREAPYHSGPMKTFNHRNRPVPYARFSNRT